MILFLLLFCLSVGSFSQSVYIDPVTSAAIASHAVVINQGLKKSNDNLSLVAKGQLAVSAQLLIINDMQARIYSGLSEVSSILNNLVSVKEIAEIGIDIVEDIEKAGLLAKSNPLLLLFAEQSARDFQSRAIKLSAEVTGFALKGGNANLMDAGERAKLLNHIATEMRILRGIAYGMQRAMYWAKMKGIFNALNPLSSWINMDVRLANDVLNTAKYLNK